MVSAVRLVTLIASCVASSACTVVTVNDGHGVHTRYYPGVAVVRIEPGDSMQVTDIQSIGGVVAAGQLNLGWSHSRIARVAPGRCQFIAWDASPEQLAGLRGLLGERTELCDKEGNLR